MRQDFRNDPAFSVTAAGVRLKIFRAGTSFALKGRIAQPDFSDALRGIHSHFAYEVFFATQGTLTLLTGEESRIYERKIAIVPPRLRHCSFPLQDGSFCLLFDFEASHEDARRAQALKALFEDGIFAAPMDEETAFYIRRLTRRSEETDSAAPKDVEMLASLLFSRLFRTLVPDEPHRETIRHSARHMHEIEFFINSHIEQRITLETAAAHVFLSTRQVSRIVRQAYDCTFSELVNEKKLAAAEMLLRNTDMKISAIAQRVNMGAENYFFTRFKRRYGVSPLKYRQQCSMSE